MSLVFIKSLGIAVPSDYIQNFALHSERRRSFELQNPNDATADLNVITRVVLMCGVTLTLPVEMLNSDTAEVINARFEDEIAQSREKQRAAEEKPKRGRGRRARVEEPEVDEEDEEDIQPNFKAVFIPVAQYQVEVENAPLLESKALKDFSEKNFSIVEAKVAQFLANRKRLEELRSMMKAPSSSDLESSLGLGAEERIDAEGINNYENNMRSSIQKLEESLRERRNYFADEVLTRANKLSKTTTSLVTSDIKFGEHNITLDDILKHVRDELFGKVVTA